MTKCILALALVFITAGTVSARADNVVVVRQQPDRVVYVSGDDVDETYIVHTAPRDYGLKITNIDRNGHSIDGSDITIRDRDGNILRHSSYTGPIYYTDLAPGNYIVEAHNGVQHQSYELTIGTAEANMTLFWQKI
jgi:hypothetical protein